MGLAHSAMTCQRPAYLHLCRMPAKRKQPSKETPKTAKEETLKTTKETPKNKKQRLEIEQARKKSDARGLQGNSPGLGDRAGEDLDVAYSLRAIGDRYYVTAADVEGYRKLREGLDPTKATSELPVPRARRSNKSTSSSSSSSSSSSQPSSELESKSTDEPPPGSLPADASASAPGERRAVLPYAGWYPVERTSLPTQAEVPSMIHPGTHNCIMLFGLPCFCFCALARRVSSLQEASRKWV